MTTTMTNEMKIQVAEKSVYGNVLIYPACKTAHIFASLVGKKTFTANDLDLIAALGYKIDIQKLPA